MSLYMPHPVDLPCAITIAPPFLPDEFPLVVLQTHHILQEAFPNPNIWSSPLDNVHCIVRAYEWQELCLVHHCITIVQHSVCTSQARSTFCK